MIIIKLVFYLVCAMTLAGLADYVFHRERWRKWPRYIAAAILFIISLELFQAAGGIIFNELGVPVPSWLEWLIDESA
ncbi:hypothetical protein [Paenilisteria rocourtiae]|uniref:Lycopene cyclase domain-containing protein n=1 Tax=Listeria rocourtiae TaxID=647910 RepID=A0A4R6ZLF2_9LIST|nr:hypothetical protein [Listeria rocourtiae]EUJ42498.1 hypothetical protein PROCOU_17084 [Listeria rocourtiae FSL F6-920]MBC1604361.1 hypothetical protein [Listeria rocourtiae]TDR52924.1 hypothetical protein DFP96_106131 [Listeria rocourtiae]